MRLLSTAASCEARFVVDVLATRIVQIPGIVLLMAQSMIPFHAIWIRRAPPQNRKFIDCQLLEASPWRTLQPAL